MSLDIILWIVAFVAFLIAFAPVDTRGWKFEWLAFAAIALTFVVA